MVKCVSSELSYISFCQCVRHLNSLVQIYGLAIFLDTEEKLRNWRSFIRHVDARKRKPRNFLCTVTYQIACLIKDREIITILSMRVIFEFGFL